MVNEPPELDPETKERWLGLRSGNSRTSDLRVLVEDLRAALTGYDGYLDRVESADSFDALESEIQADYDDVSEYSDEEIADSVATLDDSYADWSSYQSDATAEDGWDAYRQVLLDADLSPVDADRHLQLLQTWYDPSFTIHIDRDEITSWGDWETYVSDAGLSEDRAAQFRSKLEDSYADFETFESDVLETTDPLSAILNRSSHSNSVDIEGVEFRYWEESGETASGVATQPGDVSMRVEGRLFQETAFGGTSGGGESGKSGSTDSLSWGDTTAADAELTVSEETTVEATVENDGSGDVSTSVPFVVDGSVERTIGPVTVPADDSRTVTTEFHGRRGSGYYEIVLGDGAAAEVAVVPRGIG